MIFIKKILEHISSINTVAFFSLIFLYQLLFIFWGIDISDMGLTANTLPADF
jgi:hypothetical protein